MKLNRKLTEEFALSRFWPLPVSLLNAMSLAVPTDKYIVDNCFIAPPFRAILIL